MPAPQPTPGTPATSTAHAPGGWLSEIPGTPFWLSREFNEALWGGQPLTGTPYESEIMPAITGSIVDPLVGAAGKQIGTGLVVAGIAGTVIVLGLAGLGIAAWKLS